MLNRATGKPGLSSEMLCGPALCGLYFHCLSFCFLSIPCAGLATVPDRKSLRDRDPEHYFDCSSIEVLDPEVAAQEVMDGEVALNCSEKFLS